MEIDMKESGKMAKCMAKVLLQIQMGTKQKGHGSSTNFR